MSLRRSIRQPLAENIKKNILRPGPLSYRVLYRDFSREELKTVDIFTSASGSQWLDFDGNYRTTGINEAVYEGSRYLSPGVYSWFDLSGNLIPGIKLTTGPAVTNKCQTFGFVPDDELQAELWTGTPGLGVGWTDNLDGTYTCDGSQTSNSNLTKTVSAGKGLGFDTSVTLSGVGAGNVRTIAGNNGALDGSAWFGTDGEHNERVFNYNGIGTQINVQADVDFVGTVSLISFKEVKYAVGTKSFHDGTSFIQNIDGMILSGDVVGVLSIVDDTTQLDTDGLGGVERNGKCYQLDNSLGSINTSAAVSGNPANTNIHSWLLLWRGSGSGKVLIGGVDESPVSMPSSYDRKVREGVIPANAFVASEIRSLAGGTINFLLPGLYERSYAPRQPVPASSLIASTTRSASLSTLPVQMPQSFEITIELTPDADGIDVSGASVRLFGTNDSRGTGNEVRVFGGTYGATFISGGIGFNILLSDIVKGTENLWLFSAKQNGANIDVMIERDGIVKVSQSLAGILDHSNLNTITPGHWNGVHFPGQVKTIEVKAI